MSFDIAKNFIDQLLNNNFSFATTENARTIIIEFIGGEPFLEIDLIYQITEYIIHQMIQKHHPWLPLFRISICSNGVLYFSKKVQEYFIKFNHWIAFTISIDGNKELHDSCRIFPNGEGSYEKAIMAVRDYRKKYNINIPTKMTIAPENIKYLYNAVINLINEGYDQILLNYVYENVWNQQYANILYTEMVKISDYLIDNNLYNKIYISLFDHDLFVPMAEDDNNNFCGGTGNQIISIDYLGNMYPCIRFMESSLNQSQSPLIIGDIFNGYLSTNKYKDNYNKILNITRRSQSSDECFYCPIAKGCGWCSALNYEIFGTLNKRTTYICDMHKARALANKYYWDKLYNKLNII